MKYYRLLILFLIGINQLHSQNIGINATGATPNASALLDVSAGDKGVLIPNVNLTNETDAVTIASPAPGLMVYNTNVALPCGVGYYYNSNTAAAPVWLCFTKEKIVVHKYSTDTVHHSANNTPIIQPGLTHTFTIPAGQTADVQVYFSLGTLFSGFAANNLYAFVCADVYLDGVIIPIGGRAQTALLTNNNGTIVDARILSLNAFVTVTAGAHTIDIRCSKIASNRNPKTGNNCSTSATIPNCGQMDLTIQYK